MWSQILKKFSAFPAQEKVVRLLLKRGFQVASDGKVVSGTIGIPHTKIAKEVGVDRRVVDATTEVILGDEALKKVFRNIETIAFLRNVAPEIGLGVIEISPKDAKEVGLLSEIASIVADHKIGIRQAVCDDPFFTEDAKLTIVTDVPIPGDLVEEVKKLSGVKSVTVY